MRATVRDRDGRRLDRTLGGAGLLDVSSALFPFLLQRSGLIGSSYHFRFPFLSSCRVHAHVGAHFFFLTCLQRSDEICSN